MMDFSWSAIEMQEQSSARVHACQHLRRVADQVGFDKTAWSSLGQFGTFRAEDCGPERYLHRTAMLLEAFGKGGADRGLLFAAGAHFFGCTVPVLQFATETQRQQWQSALCSGKQIGSLAISEPGVGSVVSAIETTAAGCDDGFVLNGIKTYVTNAPICDLILVLAKEFPGRGSLGLSAFLVPSATAGVEVTALRAVGLEGAPAGQIRLTNVRLPGASRLGAAGGGLAVLLSAMQAERTAILSGFLGAAEFDLAQCHAYMTQRRQENSQKSLGDHQAVQHRFAEIRCRLESARWLMYRGIWEVEHGTDRLAWPAIVKKTVSESLLQCAQDLQRLYAGAGWLNHNNSATAVQDAMAILSASGTSDIQLNVISSQISKTLVSLK